MNNQKSETYQNLLKAFSDPNFQSEINQYRYAIEQELGKFIEWLLTELDPRQMIFRSPESRIKSRPGFAEKISRKDYIHKWEIHGDLRSIQNEILARLPDLIGFRITCFFMEEEKIIYQKLKTYYETGRFSEIDLDFTEGTTQKNGHKIYKVSGVYQKKVCFELQIKSAVHNIWGEVEHKTIYKGSQYAVDLKQRQTITGEIFNILKASDQQLLSLFTHQYTEQDLVCGLFAEKTRQNVLQACGTEYLAGHYKSFFDLFLSTSQEDILNYVSASLSKAPYRKRPVKIQENVPQLTELAFHIKETFLEYYLQVQYNIAQELYLFEDYDQFILYLASTIISFYLVKDEDDPEWLEEDAFSEPDDMDTDGGSDQEKMEMLLNLLKDKLPDALKEGK